MSTKRREAILLSAVRNINDYRSRDTLDVLRELFLLASKGQIAGIGFNVELKDGRQKTGFTGKYKADPAEAQRVANQISERLNEANAAREQAAQGDDDEDSVPDDPSGVVRRLRR